MSSETLENAVVRLLRERPFYGHFILNLRREQRNLDGKAAGVTVRDGIPVLAIDQVPFSLLTAPQQRSLLRGIHERPSPHVELAGLSGEFKIDIVDGKHLYEFTYRFAPA